MSNEFDPFAAVPERISPLTASGLQWLDQQLTEDNRALFRSLPIERQAAVLARLIEDGAIGPHPQAVRHVLDTLTADSERADDQDQEADR